MDAPSLPRAVLELRALLGVSREAVAAAIGKTATAVSFWEKGLRTPQDTARCLLVGYAKEAGEERRRQIESARGSEAAADFAKKLDALVSVIEPRSAVPTSPAS